MASKQNKQLAEKVQEIKRMQANWMQQRETHSDESTRGKGQRATLASHQNGQSKKSTGTAKKEDKMTWVISSDGGTKKKNLRTRSASPAGRQKGTGTTKTDTGRQIRPGSGKSNSGSRPGSGRDQGRDRGLSSKPPVAKGSISDRSVSNKSVSSNRNSNLTNGKLASRTASEPNLVAKENDELQMDDPFDRTTHTLNRNLNNESETTNQSNDGVSSTSDYSSQSGTSKPIENGQSETRTSGRNLLEPDVFDRLADQIASRVKMEMRQKRQDIRQSTGVPLKSVLDDDENDSMLSSHHCIKCKQKMIPPDYIPTVLIPCGHTFCEPCAEDRIKCPTCRTKVTSTAENSTLLQIIMGSTPNKRTQSTNKQTSNPTNQHSHPPSNEPYHPGNYTSNHDHKRLPSEEQNLSKWSGIDDERTPKQSHPAKVEKSVSRKRIEDPRVRAEKYMSEFESLSIRCEAMRDEEQTVMEDVEETNREIMQQKKTVGNISKQQDRLREEIQQLQDKIGMLDEHRAEYEQKCEDLEEDKTEKITQLHMVRQMLRQLEGDKDKVRMLAQDVGVFLK